MAAHRSQGIPISQVRLYAGLALAVVLLALAVLLATALNDPSSNWTVYGGAASAWVVFMLKDRIQRHA
jgi:hypothetical protein